ncbi:hypothetical protein IJ732_08150 [bacterium]|nr:hypothetical protein [bacterium]
MKPLDSGLFDKIKTAAFGKMSHGLGSMLIVTSAMGWALASAAQICGIAKNDKYSKEEKNFLVKQEIADASLNILSFCAITTTFKNLSRGLIDSGKIVTPKISNFCKKQGFDLTQPKTSISKLVNEKLENTISNIQKAKETGLGDIKALRKDRNSLRAFRNRTLMPLESGAEVVGTLTGGILASNVITPICRNKIAAASVKKQQQPQQKPYKNTYIPCVGLKV